MDSSAPLLEDPRKVAASWSEALKAKLAALKIEHSELDGMIARLAERVPVDQLELQWLKNESSCSKIKSPRSRASCPTSSPDAVPEAGRRSRK